MEPAELFLRIRKNLTCFKLSTEEVDQLERLWALKVPPLDGEAFNQAAEECAQEKWTLEPDTTMAVRYGFRQGVLWRERNLFPSSES